MDSPLIKRYTPYPRPRWEYSINGDFFGLKVNPSGRIIHSNRTEGYITIIDKRNGADIFTHTTFRDAYNHIIEKVIKPYFVHN
jgi:hypothetical protein